MHHLCIPHLLKIYKHRKMRKKYIKMLKVLPLERKIVRD